MEFASPSRGGRPRGFDRDAAVDTALTLFWRHGYEGVSIGDLTAAIGIAAPSLYAAFGSKAALYREVLDRYASVAAPADLSGFDAADTLPEAASRFFGASIRAVTRPGGEPGCMISTGLLAAGAEHRALADDLARRRADFRDALAGKLRRFVPDAEAAPLARTLTAVLQGIAVQARDGAGTAELDAVADRIVAGLPATGPRR